MLQRTPSMRRAIALHESAYQVAGRILNVDVRPPERDLCSVRRHACDVLATHHPRTPEGLERGALVLLAAHIVIHRAGDPIGNARDELEARELIFMELELQWGSWEAVATLSAKFRRDYTNQRCAELTAAAG